MRNMQFQLSVCRE